MHYTTAGEGMKGEKKRQSKENQEVSELYEIANTMRKNAQWMINKGAEEI